MSSAHDNARLVRGAGLLVAGGILTQVLLAVTGLLIARTVGPVAYGQYATAFALAGAFAHAFLFGLDSVVTREIARKPALAFMIVPTVLLLVACWSVILVVFIVALGNMLNYSSPIIALLMIAGPAVAFQAMANLMRAVFRGYERMELDVATQLFANLAGLCLVYITLRLWASVFAATVAIGVGTLLAVVWAMNRWWRVSRADLSCSKDLMWRLVRNAAPIGITFSVIGTSMRLDILILSLLASDLDAGLYAAAFAFAVTTRPVSLMLSAALLPRLSSLARHDESRFASVWEKGLRYSVIVGFAAGLIVSMLARFLITTFYGVDYEGSINALRVLGFGMALLAVNTYLWHALIAIDMQKVVMYVSFVGLGATVALSLLLVPHLGTVGSAFAVFGREACQLIVSFYVALKTLPAVEFRRLLVPPLLASMALISCFVVFKIQEGYLALVLAPAALVVYLFVLIITSGIQPAELRAVRAVISHTRLTSGGSTNR